MVSEVCTKFYSGRIKKWIIYEILFAYKLYMQMNWPKEGHYELNQKMELYFFHIGSAQVKCWRFISNIFYAMNFQHFIPSNNSDDTITYSSKIHHTFPKIDRCHKLKKKNIEYDELIIWKESNLACLKTTTTSLIQSPSSYSDYQCLRHTKVKVLLSCVK